MRGFPERDIEALVRIVEEENAKSVECLHEEIRGNFCLLCGAEQLPTERMIPTYCRGEA